MFKDTSVGGIPIQYHVEDTIAQRTRAIERFRAGTHPAITLGMSEPAPLDPSLDTYPKKDTYQFQEFAGFVFEFGGYGDITLIDPYSLKRLWVGGVISGSEDPNPRSTWASLRLVLDVAEALNFPDCEETEDE